MLDRWQNQEEAYQFAMAHQSCMLDMEMGTGKTRVAIDVAFGNPEVLQILVVCPKAVVPVWRENLEKFAPEGKWSCWDRQTGSVSAKANDLKQWMNDTNNIFKQFVIINYDSVWRKPMGDYILKAGFNMVIMDESHRIKSAGSKVSKFAALLGKRVGRKMCLSGTPMANSPLDVYGQYRFLDWRIFGTNHYNFLQEYAVMGGPERRFIIGYKNQQKLIAKFNLIAYTCKMSDIAERIKLPDSLPPTKQLVSLPSRDMKTMKQLNREFMTECTGGAIVVSNVLVKMIRLQQICAGFCQVQDGPLGQISIQEMNTAKEDALGEILMDISPVASVVVFCAFVHDLDTVARVATKAKRNVFELSGRMNELEVWKTYPGAVLAVQIQAGAEGVDMTMANHAIYFTLPKSLALYEQSKARLYRPGQHNPVSFIHILAKDTIDESMYKSLINKEDMIQAIKQGTFDFGFIK